MLKKITIFVNFYEKNIKFLAIFWQSNGKFLEGQILTTTTPLLRLQVLLKSNSSSTSTVLNRHLTSVVHKNRTDILLGHLQKTTPSPAFSIRACSISRQSAFCVTLPPCSTCSQILMMGLWSPVESSDKSLCRCRLTHHSYVASWEYR